MSLKYKPIDIIHKDDVMFVQTEPNSYYWTSVEMLMEWLKYAPTKCKDVDDLAEELRIGLENTIKNGYNLKKDE